MMSAASGSAMASASSVGFTTKSMKAIWFAASVSSPSLGERSQNASTESPSSRSTSPCV